MIYSDDEVYGYKGTTMDDEVYGHETEEIPTTEEVKREIMMKFRDGRIMLFFKKVKNVRKKRYYIPES